MSKPTTTRERLLLLMADGELWEVRQLAYRLDIHEVTIRTLLNKLKDEDCVEVKRYKRKPHRTCKPPNKWRLK